MARLTDSLILLLAGSFLPLLSTFLLPNLPLPFVFAVLFSGVRQRHASCRDSVISNTAGDASAAAATALPSLPPRRAGHGQKPPNARCTGSSRYRMDGRRGPMETESQMVCGCTTTAGLPFLDLSDSHEMPFHKPAFISRTREAHLVVLWDWVSLGPEPIHLFPAKCSALFPRVFLSPNARKRRVKFVSASSMRNGLVFNGTNYILPPLRSFLSSENWRSRRSEVCSAVCRLRS